MNYNGVSLNASVNVSDLEKFRYNLEQAGKLDIKNPWSSYNACLDLYWSNYIKFSRLSQDKIDGLDVDEDLQACIVDTMTSYVWCRVFKNMLIKKDTGLYNPCIGIKNDLSADELIELYKKESDSEQRLTYFEQARFLRHQVANKKTLNI